MKKAVYITVILFSSFCFAQDNSEKIVEVAYNACECIGKMDLKLDYKEKSEAIKECIKSANMSYQLTNKLAGISEKLKDTLPETTTNKTTDTINVEPLEVNISINESEDFKEIEAYLLETCGDLESLYFSNNKETSKKSISQKEEALKYYDLGIDAGENQDYEKALEYYKKALKIDKKFTFAWDNLGITYRNWEIIKKQLKHIKNH
ncbi:tetratricopeptide repeat protein [Pontimicrobium sp. MEBiC01747]